MSFSRVNKEFKFCVENIVKNIYGILMCLKY